ATEPPLPVGGAVLLVPMVALAVLPVPRATALLPVPPVAVALALVPMAVAVSPGPAVALAFAPRAKALESVPDEVAVALPRSIEGPSTDTATLGPCGVDTEGFAD